MAKNFRDWVCESLESNQEAQEESLEKDYERWSEENMETNDASIDEYNRSWDLSDTIESFKRRYLSKESSDEWDDDVYYCDDYNDDWFDSYRDAFEDDPEACWGREW